MDQLGRRGRGGSGVLSSGSGVMSSGSGALSSGSDVLSSSGRSGSGELSQAGFMIR